MANALDVAAYIIKKRGSMPAMKLHKLVYYSQAWSLVWDDDHLFKDRIEAWINGPAIPRLYRCHRGEYEVTKHHFSKGNPSDLDANQQDTINVVLDAYGDKSAQWLRELTHAEKPWQLARIGLKPLERGDQEITRESMHDYYDSIMR